MAKRLNVRRERVRDARGPRELQAVFKEVHQHGSKALKAGDYKTFAAAVEQEKSLILEQQAAIQKQSAALKQLRARALVGAAERRRRPSRRRRS